MMNNDIDYITVLIFIIIFRNVLYQLTLDLTVKSKILWSMNATAQELCLLDEDVSPCFLI